MFSTLLKLRGIAALLLFFCLSSCEYFKAVDDVVAPDTTNSQFLIKKGEHSTNGFIKKVSGTSMRYEVMFDSSAVYATINPSNQGDINKLFGTSDCGSQHHINSARFGWRWFENRLEIHAYTYVNGIRNSQYVSTIELGKKYAFEIVFADNKYEFLLNDRRVTMQRNCTGAVDGYMLFPYFGGDETAPHDIKINLSKL